MFSGSVTPTSRQCHCKAGTQDGSADGPVRTAGPATSNRPKPYSAFSKICQKVPIVFVVIPAVPGGGTSGTAPPAGQTARGLQARLLQEPDLVDAVPEGRAGAHRARGRHRQRPASRPASARQSRAGTAAVRGCV